MSAAGLVERRGGVADRRRRRRSAAPFKPFYAFPFFPIRRGTVCAHYGPPCAPTTRTLCAHYVVVGAVCARAVCAHYGVPVRAHAAPTSNDLVARRPTPCSPEHPGEMSRFHEGRQLPLDRGVVNPGLSGEAAQADPRLPGVPVGAVGDDEQDGSAGAFHSASLDHMTQGGIVHRPPSGAFRSRSTWPAPRVAASRYAIALAARSPRNSCRSRQSARSANSSRCRRRSTTRA